jgi:threonyl-tRNA synthetase
MQKIPYMLVVGAKEAEQGVVSVRSRYNGDEGQKDLDTFLSEIKEEIRTRETKKVTVNTEA